MTMDAANLSSASKLRPSGNVVPRLIEGELILIPMSAGVGDLEGDIFALSGTGRAIWDALDGDRSLGAVAELLAAEYAGDAAEIERHVLGFCSELVRRGMLAV